MKASELRIGNLVLDTFGKEVEVKDIMTYGINSQWGCSTFNYEELKPIPLTEEWLLKFGFKYTKMEVGFNQFRKGILELSITPNGYELFFTYKWVKIEYVHQLQNLYFALTNEELTYEQQK